MTNFYIWPAVIKLDSLFNKLIDEVLVIDGPIEPSITSPLISKRPINNNIILIHKVGGLTKVIRGKGCWEVQGTKLRSELCKRWRGHNNELAPICIHLWPSWR